LKKASRKVREGRKGKLYKKNLCGLCVRNNGVFNRLLGESNQTCREPSIKRWKIPTSQLKAGENFLTLDLKIDSNATGNCFAFGSPYGWNSGSIESTFAA